MSTGMYHEAAPAIVGRSVGSSGAIYDEHEIRAIVARSRTKAVGASAGVRGAVTEDLDLGVTLGLGTTREEHSATVYQTCSECYSVLLSNDRKLQNYAMNKVYYLAIGLVLLVAIWYRLGLNTSQPETTWHLRVSEGEGQGGRRGESDRAATGGLSGTVRSLPPAAPSEVPGKGGVKSADPKDSRSI